MKSNPLTQFRLLLAETFLGWAMSMAPKGHPDSTRMILAIGDYLKGCAKPSKAADQTEALRRIRFAGNATGADAVWMQKVAAHAMEPHRWPDPGEQQH